MEINIGDKVVEARMDIILFKRAFKGSLDLYHSIKKSTDIFENKFNLSKEKIMLYIYAETNWVFFFSNLKGTDKKEVLFRLYAVKYKDFFKYKINSRDRAFRNISLEQKRVSGNDILVTNNLILTPESFIDLWLQKRLLNYVNDGGEVYEML